MELYLLFAGLWATFAAIVYNGDEPVFYPWILNFALFPICIIISSFALLIIYQNNRRN